MFVFPGHYSRRNILPCCRYRRLVLLLLILPMASCREMQSTFTEVSSVSGIDFRYNFGDSTYQNILESSGSGVTVFDYDLDGWMDLYMMNGTWLEGISDSTGIAFKDTPNKLYRNNGNGSFTECGVDAGLDDRNWSMAAGPVDIDIDGDPDLYLLNYGPNRFFLNHGRGHFTDVTGELGLRGPDSLNGFPKWSVGVIYWDYNCDGKLDLLVGNFLAFDRDYISPITPEMMPHPSEYRGQASMLYRQEPDGSFLDVTRENGLYFPDSKCMGLSVWDYDEDGDLDIFQGNDHQMNFLFENRDGTFCNVAGLAGVAANSRGIPTGSMHGAIGDIDGDGHLDLLVPDLRYGALYRNMGGGIFEDITEISGVAAVFDGKGQWSSLFVDYDNDGDLDIFSANGTAEELILQLPVMLENDGTGKFRDVGPALSPYFSRKRSGRAAAVWDYDNDGDMDIIVSNIDLEASPALLRNDSRNRNHWLGIQLKSEKGPVPAAGARLVVYAGDLRQVYVNQPNNGYLSWSDPRIHVGLGRQRKADSIRVFWSDGHSEVFINPGSDRYIKLLQGQGIKPTL